MMEVRGEKTFSEKKRIGSQLSQLSKKLLQKSNDTVIPTSVKEVLDEKMPQFAGYDQHDAHEFLLSLLQGLEEENPKVIEEEYGGEIQRTLNCHKCQDRRVIKESFRVLSVPIKDYGRRELKILLIDRNRHMMVKFHISAKANVREWKAQFEQAISLGKEEKCIICEVVMGKINKVYSSEPEDKSYRDLNISASDLVVAYKLSSKPKPSSHKLSKRYYFTKDDEICLAQEPKEKLPLTVKLKRKHTYNYEELAEEELTLVPNESCKKELLVEVFNEDNTYSEYINYPFYFALDRQVPIKAVEDELIEIVSGPKTYKDLTLKVRDRAKGSCFFCKGVSRCKFESCFSRYALDFPLGYLHDQVDFVLSWNSAKDYKNHILKATQKEMSESKNYLTSLDQSLQLFKQPQMVEIRCEKCKFQKMESVYRIRVLPNILIVHLNRFAYNASEEEGNISTKIYTQWNLETDIELNKKQYGLRGIVMHSGNNNSGHYVAVTEKYKYDDSWVIPFHFKSVDLSQIYILFYVQKLSK